jgi:glutaminyl-tRNA synthetase
VSSTRAIDPRRSITTEATRRGDLTEQEASDSNFIRQAIESDLASGRFGQRGWGGGPGPAARHREARPDPARIRTRFPPEPNGYLHIGHAKSICLNFGTALRYDGRCHMRFDDTNPVKEDQEYVDAILDAVRWLGFDWTHPDGDDLYYASDYFEELYRFALVLIERGHAYVDSQPAEAIRVGRGTLTEPGADSPYRDRPAAESLALFREMRAGRHPDGSHVLRARIDMGSPNINLRDPVLYRIRHAPHHRTGDAWPIYPMYDYAHPLSDALERITHSLCTLEFEDHRPLYDWLIARLAEAGEFDDPVPRQIEFARLNLTYTITSKRKLLELVTRGHVDGWDDPRLPTLFGLRRRGYTPESIRLFSDRVGVSKAHQLIDPGTLDQALREDLEPKADRLMVVVDPLKLVIDNFPGAGAEPAGLTALRHPQHPERPVRHLRLERELWIERDDFAIDPPKGYFRLSPDRMVRLRHGYVVRCTGHETDDQGRVTVVHAEMLPDTRSGTPGADSVKVKGNIHWVGVTAAVPVEVRLFERLFTEAQPDAGGRDPLTVLNPASRRIVQGWGEPTLADVAPETRLQFERLGWFVADRVDHRPGRAVVNRITTLKDSFGRKG